MARGRKLGRQSPSWRARIKPGEVVGITLGEHEIALYNLDGAIYATDNICTHAFAYP